MTHHNPFQIVIPRRAPTCFHGGEAFVKGEEYYSTIAPGEGEGVFERRDFCMKCASELIKKKDFQKGASLWKSAIPPKKEPSDLPKQREARALALLKEAIASGHADSEAFVLALFLARRRLIFQRQELSLPNGRMGIVYEVPETEEMLCVPKITLSELQVEKVQTEIAAKLL